MKNRKNYSKDEKELISKAMRALVNRRWAKTTPKQRSEYAKMLNKAKWNKKHEKI